jgi:hypothetical protein
MWLRNHAGHRAIHYKIVVFVRKAYLPDVSVETAGNGVRKLDHCN